MKQSRRRLSDSSGSSSGEDLERKRPHLSLQKRPGDTGREHAGHAEDRSRGGDDYDDRQMTVAHVPAKNSIGPPRPPMQTQAGVAAPSR
jgi:hypothetical protein